MTMALFQCEFGGNSSKPTRLIKNLQNFEGPYHEGISTFIADWRYLGPLPKSCPHPGQHEQLIGLDDSGKWKSGPAAHYPEELCLFIAKAIAKTFASWGRSLPQKTPSHPSQSEGTNFGLESFEASLHGEDSTAVETPDINYKEILSGCSGPPMTARYCTLAGLKTLWTDWDYAVRDVGILRSEPSQRHVNKLTSRHLSETWWTNFARTKSKT